jgi:hypothetical protein
MKKSFLDAMEHRAGPAFAKAAAHVLEKMSLPDPAPGEYLDGNEARLVFLDDYGLVLRAGRPLSVPENNLILAPLRATKPLTFRAARHVLELLPGVTARVRDADAVADIRKSLRACGVYFWDRQSANCGYLPIRNEYYPNGIPVVIDRGAVKRDHNPGTMNMNGFQPVSYSGTQRDIYAPLLRKLEKAWPANENLPRGSMRAFMLACRNDMRGSGHNLLSNKWGGDPALDPDYSETDSEGSGSYGIYANKPLLAAEAGAAYAKRLHGAPEP